MCVFVRARKARNDVSRSQRILQGAIMMVAYHLVSYKDVCVK